MSGWWDSKRSDGADGFIRWRVTQSVRFAAVAVVLAVGLALLLGQTGAFETLELKTVDVRFAVRGTHKPSPNVVIVGIDDETFGRLDLQWPFPRSLDAKVIERLKRDGARAIVYDVQFTEPTTPVNSTRPAEQAAVDQDNALITAVRRAGNVALATSEVGPGGENAVLGGGDIMKRIGARAGAAVFSPDADGVDRRMSFSYKGLRTLGIVGAELAVGHAFSPIALGGSRAWIDFAGPAGTFPEVSFVSVLRGEVPAQELSGKTIIVGATASSLQDVHETPFSDAGLMSGAEITANAIATADRGFPLQPSGSYVVILLIVGFGMLAPGLGLRLAPGWVIASSVSAGVAYAVSVQLAFDAGLLLPLVQPLTALALGGLGAVVADSLGERRRLQALKRALGSVNDRPPRFFISYRRSQSPWPAAVLNRELVERFGSGSVFMDRTAIDAGDIWPEEIEEAISRCSVMFVLIGPDWLGVQKPDGSRRLDDADDWVRREIAAGLESPGAIVVPVLLDGAEMPTAVELPEPLKRLALSHAVRFNSEDLGAEIDRLVDSIESKLVRGVLRRQASSIGL